MFHFDICQGLVEALLCKTSVRAPQKPQNDQDSKSIVVVFKAPVLE